MNTSRVTAAIALGSNLSSSFGDRADNLHEALHRIEVLGTVTDVSSFYETFPVGDLHQPQFLNAAALLETHLPPGELLGALLDIERHMGRDRSTATPKGPRIIDLDLLLYGNKIIQTCELTLPHPAMHERAFVLEPLAEIASEMQHPTLHRTVGELLSQLR